MCVLETTGSWPTDTSLRQNPPYPDGALDLDPYGASPDQLLSRSADPRLLFGLYGLIIIAAEFAMCEGDSRANLFREGRAHVGTRVSPTSAESPTTNWNGSIPAQNG
jgi:hypothetical protein